MKTNASTDFFPKSYPEHEPFLGMLAKKENDDDTEDPCPPEDGDIEPNKPDIPCPPAV